MTTATATSLKSWRTLEGAAVGRDVLLVGNGPGRLGLSSMVHVAAQLGCFVIGCNAYWREWLPIPDVLVCYDAFQTREALARTSIAPIVVPEQRSEFVSVECSEVDAQRLLEAAPHHGTCETLPDDWTPKRSALGNLSGLLAYQAALLTKPRSVYLLGVDCAGILVASDEGVRISAVSGQTPGYGPCTVPAYIMRGSPPMPSGWETHRTLWRGLTRWAADQGVETFRATGHGALDWLEIRTPCLV